MTLSRLFHQCQALEGCSYALVACSLAVFAVWFVLSWQYPQFDLLCRPDICM